MVSPRGPAKSFSTLNNSPLPRAKNKYQNFTIPPEFLWFPRECPGVELQGSKWEVPLFMVWGSEFCPCEGAEPGVNFTTFMVLSPHKKSDDVIEKGEGDTSWCLLKSSCIKLTAILQIFTNQINRKVKWHSNIFLHMCTVMPTCIGMVHRVSPSF